MAQAADGRGDPVASPCVDSKGHTAPRSRPDGGAVWPGTPRQSPGPSGQTWMRPVSAARRSGLLPAAGRRETRMAEAARHEVTDASAAVEALARNPRPDGTAPQTIRPLFAADPGRFGRFSWAADGLLLDLSKTAITDAVLAALLGLAEAAGLAARRDAMARGEAVNATERRAVLHL